MMQGSPEIAWFPLSHHNSECAWCGIILFSSEHCWHNTLFYFNCFIHVNMYISTQIPKLAIDLYSLAPGQTFHAFSWQMSLQLVCGKQCIEIWLDLWTGDELCIFWYNFLTQSWLQLDGEMPDRMKQIIGSKKSIFVIFAIQMRSLL
jgi:hypothetical protein